MERQWNLREWAAYEHAMREGRSVVAGHERLSPAEVALEEVYLGLRTHDGVPSAWIPAATGQAWCQAGWAVAAGERLRLTPEGWLRLDALVAAVELVGAPSGS
jgi:coproporphyrinogen III oxidase-like Fe-S oxidoreductase